MVNTVYLNPDGSIDQSINDLIQTFASQTISSDAITFATSAATLDTQGAAATDDLSTIVATAAEVGTMFIIRSTSEDRRIVVKHEVGNIWSAGGDITLKSPRQLLFLIYDGAYWIVFGCCGSAADATEVEPDEGEELKCILATRVIDYIELMLGDVATAIAGGVTAVALQLTTYFNLVGATASPSAVLALANLIVSSYADDTAFDADFTSGLFVSMTCYAYCAKGAEDTTYTSGDMSTIQDFIGGESGTEWDILSAIFDILGPDGMTNAIATSVLVATDADCSSDCSCNWTFEWTLSGMNTLEGCTAKPRVVLHLGGGGSLPYDVDVAISVTGGTASGSDYTLDTATITFLTGSVDGDTVEAESTITSGDGADDGETIELSLTPDEGEVEGIATHTLTIIAGGCAKTWQHDFQPDTTAGMGLWTLDAGSLASYGISNSTSAGGGHYYGRASIELALYGSTVITEVTINYEMASGGFGFRYGYIIIGGVQYDTPPGDFPTPGPSLQGESGLTVDEDTLIAASVFSSAASIIGLSHVQVKGTGINPFTGS